MKKRNKLLLLDCFGVFSTPVVVPWFLKTFGKEEGQQYSDYYCELGDKGIVDIVTEAKMVADRFNLNVNDILEDWYSGIISKEFIDFILEKKKEFVICLASNASIGLIEEVFKRNHIDEHLFDKLYISCYIKEVKPDLSIFTYILKDLNQDFDKMFMVDDRDFNLVNVSKLNIEPILFKGLDDLKKIIK